MYGRIWNEFFNWPDVENFLVLMLSRFHTTQANTSISASTRKKKMILMLVLALVLILASTPFSQ